MIGIAPLQFNAFGYLAEVGFALLGQPVYACGHGFKDARCCRVEYATAINVFIMQLEEDEAVMMRGVLGRS